MTPSRILLIDDDPFLVNALAILLTDAGYGVTTAPSIARARDILREMSPDLVLLDLTLPDGSGLDLLKEIRGNGRHPVPVLVLTGAATPDNFRESFLLEADQVIRKPAPAATLLALIRRLVVPGYPARWAFSSDDVLRLRPISYLTHLMERESPRPHRFLVVADAAALVDRQDGMGDEAINSLLKAVLFGFLFSLEQVVPAEQIEAVLTETGADIVVSILLDRGQEQNLGNLLERASHDAELQRRECAFPMRKPMKVKCIPFQPEPGGHPGRALHLALRRSQSVQRITFAETRTSPFLQGIFTAGGRLVGYEVLNRPEHFASTECFYRALQAQHLQDAVDARNLDAALPMLQRLLPGLFLSINISPGFLLQDQFAGQPLRNLSPYAPRVVLEFTERSPVLCTTPVLRKIELLREAGFSIALDDVGAGYNNLLGLVKIRPQMVKVDKTLCAGVAKDPFRAEAVRAIIQLAKKMHAVVVAEGVEKQKDVEALGFMDVDMIQGYIFHVPEAAEAVLARSAARRERSYELATTG